MQKYIMTYTRTFTTTMDCLDRANADARAKMMAKNFFPGEVTILSVLPEGYVEPAAPPLSKMELLVDGMRKKINTMLPPKDVA
jgi:hypothetical protein